MSIALVDLVARLTAAVPAYGGIPTTAQYELAVKDAVLDFSRRAGMKKLATINIVAGTASYTLPNNFLKFIRFEELGAVIGGVQVTEQGIIPLNSTIVQQHTIAGLTLTFYPTPQFTGPRYLWYKAGYELTTGVYTDMTDEVASIVMLKAQALAWKLVGGKAGTTAGWKYVVGDVTIDKTNVGKILGEWTRSFDTDYEERVKVYIGTVGFLC